MKNHNILVSTLVAAAAATFAASAFATDVTLTNGGVTTLSSASDTGSGNTYTYTAPESGTDEQGGWIQWVDGGMASDVSFSGTLSGSGLIGFYLRVGDGTHTTETVDLTGATATNFSGQLTVLNTWNNNVIAKLSGENWKGTEYVFAGASRESDNTWLNVRGYGASDRGQDTLALQGATTLAGVTGYDKSNTTIRNPTNLWIAGTDINAREFITVATAGDTLTLAGTGTYAFYGTVGTSSSAVSIAKTGTGTQTFGGTNYFKDVTVSAGTLSLDGTTTISGTATVSGGTLTLDGTITLSNAITVSSGSVSVDSSVLFNLSNLTATDSAYTLVSGASDITNWTSLTKSNFTLDGSALSGRSTVDVSTVGKVTITTVSAASLVWAGAEGSTTWSTDTSKKVWTNNSSSDAFYSGDNVTFSGTASSKAVSVGSDLTVGAMAVSDDYTFSSGTSETARTITADSFSLTAGKSATFTDVSLSSSESVNIGSGSTLSFGGTADTTAAIVLSNSVSDATFKKIGSGTTTLTGALANYHGKIAVDAGTLNVTGTLKDSYLAGITLAADTTFTYSGDAVGENQRMFSGSSTFTLTGNATVSAASNFGLISSGYAANTIELGSYTLTKTGSEIFYLANTTINGTGTFKISEGTVKLINKGSSSAEGATVLVAGGTFNTNGLTFTANGAFNVDSGATVSGGTVKVAKDSTFAGTLSAGATLNVTGGTTTISSGDQKISGNLTIASGATVSAGAGDQLDYTYNSQTITVNGTLALGSNRWSFEADDKLVLNNGTVSGSGDSYGALDFFANNTLTSTGTSSIDNVRVRGITLTANVTDTLTIGGISTSTSDTSLGTLTKTGAGKLVLSGTNRTTAINVNEGSVEFTGSETNALNLGNLTIASGATVYGAVNDQINYNASSAQTVTVSGDLKLGTSANNYASGVRWSFGTNNKLVLAGGTVSGTGDSKGYALDFFATNTVSVTENSTLAANLTVRSISSSSNTGLTVDVATDKTLSLTGQICAPGSNNGDPAALIKAGDGKIVLSGDNSSFAGGFTVSAGTLEVSHASALGTGTVSVASGATLKLDVAVTNAGTVSFADGAKIAVDLTKIEKDGSSTTEKYIYKLITGTTISFGSETSTASLMTLSADETDYSSYLDLTNSSLGDLADYARSLTVDNNSLILTISIPEPSAFGLLAGIGALAFAISRRRRSRKN